MNPPPSIGIVNSDAASLITTFLHTESSGTRQLLHVHIIYHNNHKNHLPETQRRAATHQQRTARRRPRCPLRRRSTALSSGCACCQHRRDRPARTRRRPCGQTPSPTRARKSRRASSRGRKPHRESGGRAPTWPW